MHELHFKQGNNIILNSKLIRKYSGKYLSFKYYICTTLKAVSKLILPRNFYTISETLRNTFFSI